MLENRSAVIHGGGGSIGGAVTRAFPRAAGRPRRQVSSRGTRHGQPRTGGRGDPLRRRIAGDRVRCRRHGGRGAETAQIDALDEAAVDLHADMVAANAGCIDISFHLIAYGDVRGTPLAEMRLEDFERPVITAVRTMFRPLRTTARHMIPRKAGVILVFRGYGDPPADHDLGTSGRLGRHRVTKSEIRARARTVRHPGGDPADGRCADSIPGGARPGQAITDEMPVRPCSTRPRHSTTSGVAVFAASDWPRTVNASALNTTCGSVVG